MIPSIILLYNPVPLSNDSTLRRRGKYYIAASMIFLRIAVNPARMLISALNNLTIKP